MGGHLLLLVVMGGHWESWVVIEGWVVIGGHFIRNIFRDYN
jgi:hypothetical protein